MSTTRIVPKVRGEGNYLQCDCENNLQSVIVLLLRLFLAVHNTLRPPSARVALTALCALKVGSGYAEIREGLSFLKAGGPGIPATVITRQTTPSAENKRENYTCKLHVSRRVKRAADRTNDVVT